ncbi:ester cyclase [Lysobacter xanthus]
MKAFLHLALLTAIVGASACASGPSRSVATPTEATRAVATRFLDALNRQDWAALDEMVTADYRHHVVTATGFSERTWEAFRKGNQTAHAASPDWTNTPVQMIVEGNRVAVLIAGHGTHSGSFAGEKPTGRTMDLPVAVFLEIRGDKIAADWEVSDAAPLMRKLSQP